MMNLRYHVELTEAERCELTGLLGGGKHSARKLKRAQILLAADAGVNDEAIEAGVAVGGSTVYRTKRRFIENGLEAALCEAPRPGAERKLTGREEALLIATACSSPPPGCARWTLELLAGEMVSLTEHDSLSRETVRRRLAENDLKPWQKHMWCIPRVDAEYVARMEDVLDLYAEAPDPRNAGDAAAIGRGVQAAEADVFAANTLPIVDAIRATGAIDLRGIANALNARGIRTARGGRWHVSNVKNLIDRAASL